MERIYIDTNVLIYWLFPTHPATAKPSTAFMSDIKSSGKYHGIISDFTINEMIKVIRSILVTRKITNASSWENKIKWAVEKIYNLNKDDFTVVFGMAYEDNSDDDMGFGRISYEATQLMKENQEK
ncbi:MAG: hypothetical protein OXC46_01010 [Thaumarchaeota archaeon]|nr:hypothetical protein [Nitrososphaerota archaeon]